MVWLSDLIAHSNPCSESMQTNLELNGISICLDYCGLTGIPQSGTPRWLSNSKYNNIVQAKSLTLTSHGLAMRVLLPSLQLAPEMKMKNVFPIFFLIVQSLKFNGHRTTITE